MPVLDGGVVECSHALMALLPPRFVPPADVAAAKALRDAGLERVWAKISKYVEKQVDNGGGKSGVALFKAMFEKYDMNGDVFFLQMH